MCGILSAPTTIANILRVFSWLALVGPVAVFLERRIGYGIQTIPLLLILLLSFWSFRILGRYSKKIRNLSWRPFLHLDVAGILIRATGEIGVILFLVKAMDGSGLMFGFALHRLPWFLEILVGIGFLLVVASIGFAIVHAVGDLVSGLGKKFRDGSPE